jgi:Bacterial Ig-like domain (group 3)/FG-GAP-like repeat
MTRSRSVVAALLLFLLAQAASGDCLTPLWEPRAPLPPVGPVSRSTVVVDDFDGDGIDDVVFARANVASDTVLLQRGRGNGLCDPPAAIYTTSLAGVNNPWGLQHAVARDLNRDGKLDLLLYENLTHLVFLPGNGDGTFAGPVRSPAVAGQLFALADLTGDDVDDVAAFHYKDTGFGVTLFLGSLAGTFTETTKTPLPAPPRAIAAGDVDGDGANDIVAGYGEPSTVAVLFGNDDGTFDPAVPLVNGARGIVTIILTDLENDGDLDIVAETEANESNDLAVHHNRGGRTFDTTIYGMPDAFTSLHRGTHFTVADATGDGEPDLLATNGSMVITRRGLGDGSFDHPTFDFFSESGLATAPINTSDFDGDGRMDLIIGPNGFDGLRSLRNHCGDVKVLLTPSSSTIVQGQGNVTVHVTTHGYAKDFPGLPPVDATGTVSILEGATVLTTGTLSNGAVTLNVPGLTFGAHMLLARYSGDAQYEPAQSARIIVRLVQSPPKPPPPPRRRAARP